MKCWAAVAWQARHQLQCLQSCSCTCCCSLCSICTGCRHIPLWSHRPRYSFPALAPWSRTLVKNIKRWCIQARAHSLCGFSTSNRAFIAALWQVCRPTFCSRSTLPKALLEPRPPDRKTMISNTTYYELYTIIRTSLTNPKQNHKSCFVSITPTPSQHLGELPNILGKPWPS